MEHEITEYEFTRRCTTAMMRHNVNMPLIKVHLHLDNGTKDGVFTELDFGDIAKRAERGDFIVQRGYQLSVSMKGYRADIVGSLEVADEIHSCTVEIMRQTANGWARDEEVPYVLTLTY